MASKRKSVFKAPRHDRIARTTPPSVHMLPWVTGGLKRLYQELNSNVSKQLHEFGCFTNREGHISPTDHMPLLAFRYKYVKIIGRGQSSIFIKALDTFCDDSPVAIKVLHTQYNKLGFQEFDCLRRLNLADPDGFSATIRLHTTFLFDDHYCMVFEMLDPRPLHKYFSYFHSNADRVDAVREVAICLLQALGFLRRVNIIHADLKPENLLLKNASDFKSLKIVDFGNAINCVHSELSLYHSDFELQTLIYRSPEVLFGLPFGVEVDMWSLGCILSELFTGSPLFYGRNKASVLEKMSSILGPVPRDIVRQGKFYSQFEEFTETDSQTDAPNRIMQKLRCNNFAFASFLSRLLRYNPAERMTVSEAAQHPFLAPYLGFKYLMPLAPDNQGPYSPMLLSKTTYSKSPHIEKDIHEQHMNSLELLSHGTHKVPPRTIAIKPKAVHPNGANVMPSPIPHKHDHCGHRNERRKEEADLLRASRQLLQSPDVHKTNKKSNLSSATTSCAVSLRGNHDKVVKEKVLGTVWDLHSGTTVNSSVTSSCSSDLNRSRESISSPLNTSTASPSSSHSKTVSKKWPSSKISAFMSSVSNKQEAEKMLVSRERNHKQPDACVSHQTKDKKRIQSTDGKTSKKDSLSLDSETVHSMNKHKSRSAMNAAYEEKKGSMLHKLMKLINAEQDKMSQECTTDVSPLTESKYDISFSECVEHGDLQDNIKSEAKIIPQLKSDERNVDQGSMEIYEIPVKPENLRTCPAQTKQKITEKRNDDLKIGGCHNATDRNVSDSPVDAPESVSQTDHQPLNQACVGSTGESHKRDIMLEGDRCPDHQKELEMPKSKSVHEKNQVQNIKLSGSSNTRSNSGVPLRQRKVKSSKKAQRNIRCEETIVDDRHVKKAASSVQRKTGVKKRHVNNIDQSAQPEAKCSGRRSCDTDVKAALRFPRKRHKSEKVETRARASSSINKLPKKRSGNNEEVSVKTGSCRVSSTKTRRCKKKHDYKESPENGHDFYQAERRRQDAQTQNTVPRESKKETLVHDQLAFCCESSDGASDVNSPQSDEVILL